MENNEIILKCDCSEEILRVEKLVNEFEKRDKTTILTKEVFFAIYKNYRNRESFFRRLITAFKYIITGTRYSDQIILCDSKVKQLIEFLREDSLCP